MSFMGLAVPDGRDINISICTACLTLLVRISQLATRGDVPVLILGDFNMVIGESQEVGMIGAP